MLTLALETRYGVAAVGRLVLPEPKASGTLSAMMDVIPSSGSNQRNSAWVRRQLRRISEPQVNTREWLEESINTDLR